MKRAENWPTLLTAYIEERREVPFTWGKADCCLFAADWVRLATDLDPAADLRGKYDSALGARRIIKRRGGLAAMVARALTPLSFREVALSLATRGDIIVRDSGDGDCAGVVLGKQSAFVGRDGLRFIQTNLQADARAWRI
jgi:hypothetical protein